MSVISNFYNAEHYLAEAIESVLAQDHEDFELILVDDGSTDASATIARVYTRRDPRRVRVVSSPDGRNRGISAARNLGLTHARGEFIAFIDADDRWLPAKLREQIDLLDAMPQTDAVCGRVNYWSRWNGGTDEVVPTGHVEDATVRFPDAALFWYPLGQAHAPSMSDLMIRASAVRAADGFEERFPSAYEDQAFLAKFYLRSAIYVSSATWSDYRLHDRSCMARLSSEDGYHEVRSRFLHWLEQYLESHPEVGTYAVQSALRRALLPYRHPIVGRPMRLAGRVLRRFPGA